MSSKPNPSRETVPSTHVTFHKRKKIFKQKIHQLFIDIMSNVGRLRVAGVPGVHAGGRVRLPPLQRGRAQGLPVRHTR